MYHALQTKSDSACIVWLLCFWQGGGAIYSNKDGTADITASDFVGNVGIVSHALYRRPRYCSLFHNLSTTTHHAIVLSLPNVLLLLLFWQQKGNNIYVSNTISELVSCKHGMNTFGSPEDHPPAYPEGNYPAKLCASPP